MKWKLCISLALTIIVFTSCIHVFDNDYEPLIPEYSFPDTCHGEFSSRLSNESFPNEYWFPDGSFAIVELATITKYDANGLIEWTHEAGNQIFNVMMFPNQEDIMVIKTNPSFPRFELLNSDGVLQHEYKNPNAAKKFALLTNGSYVLYGTHVSLNGVELIDRNGHTSYLEIGEGKIQSIVGTEQEWFAISEEQVFGTGETYKITVCNASGEELSTFDVDRDPEIQRQYIISSFRVGSKNVFVTQSSLRENNEKGLTFYSIDNSGNWSSIREEYEGPTDNISSIIASSNCVFVGYNTFGESSVFRYVKHDLDFSIEWTYGVGSDFNRPIFQKAQLGKNASSLLFFLEEGYDGIGKNAVLRFRRLTLDADGQTCY